MSVKEAIEFLVASPSGDSSRRKVIDTLSKAIGSAPLGELRGRRQQLAKLTSVLSEVELEWLAAPLRTHDHAELLAELLGFEPAAERPVTLAATLAVSAEEATRRAQKVAGIEWRIRNNVAELLDRLPGEVARMAALDPDDDNRGVIGGMCMELAVVDVDLLAEHRELLVEFIRETHKGVRTSMMAVAKAMDVQDGVLRAALGRGLEEPGSRMAFWSSVFLAVV